MNEPKLSDEFDQDPADQVERAEELISLCLDDLLDEQQAVELNQLMLQDPKARTSYLDAAQLHADLYSYFNEEKRGPAIAPALTLPLGGMGMPTTG